MKFFFALSVLLFILQSGMAQGSDYIIDVANRKIYGTVKLSTPAINSSRIRFKDNKSGVTRQYRPDEIKCWSRGGAVYEAKVYSAGAQKSFSVFMLRLTPEGGKCHLYEYYNTNEDMGFSQTFLFRDNEMTEVQFGRFRKQMAEYFKDYKELSKKISDKQYKKKDLLAIIEEYNAWRLYLWQE